MLPYILFGGKISRNTCYILLEILFIYFFVLFLLLNSVSMEIDKALQKWIRKKVIPTYKKTYLH